MTSETVNCDGSNYVVIEDNHQIVKWSVTQPLNIIGGSVGYKCTFNATGSGYAGSAWITATAENDCGSVSTDFQVYVDCGELLLTPNPASDQVEVSLKSGSSAQIQSVRSFQKQLNVRIFNSMGNVVYSAKKMGDKFTISTSNLKDWNYIVEVAFDNKVYRKKLVVKH